MSTESPNLPALRVSYLWRDEVMSDQVFSEPSAVSLGTTSEATVLIPDLGFPEGFELFRPGARGYVLTIGAKMKGEMQVAGAKQSVASFLSEQGGAFRGTSVGPGDFGLIQLDAKGEHSLFFTFEDSVPELPNAPIVRDPDSLLPAFAFAVIFVGFFLTYALAIYEYKGPSFLWSGRKELVANYMLNRPMVVAEEEEKKEAEVKAGTEDGEKSAKPASSVGKEAKAGGKGDKERKRAEDPDQGEPDEPLPTEVQVGLMSKKSREVFDKVRNRGGFDDKLGKAMARMKGPANGGSLAGYGDGFGTGVGEGNGTGTSTKGRKKGSGGGGSAHADVRTQGKLNTGGKRAAKGTPGGNSVKEVKVKMKTGKPSGSLGGLTQEQILKVVRSRARTIQACYSRELQRSRGLGGKVTVSWKIDSSGRVSRAKVRQSTLKNPRVEDCVVRQVNSMKFPSPKGGGSATVNFPFVFAQQ